MTTRSTGASRLLLRSEREGRKVRDKNFVAIWRREVEVREMVRRDNRTVGSIARLSGWLRIVRRLGSDDEEGGLGIEPPAVWNLRASNAVHYQENVRGDDLSPCLLTIIHLSLDFYAQT